MAVISYGDKNYQQKKALYDVLAQIFEDYKYGITSAGHSWNMPIEQLKGCTLRLLGDEHLQLTYHRYEVATVEMLRRGEETGAKFLAEVEKALKREFKKATGETLTLKKVKENRNDIDKTSRISGETSWMLGASRYGHGARPVGKYLIRDTNVYEFSADI